MSLTASSRSVARSTQPSSASTSAQCCGSTSIRSTRRGPGGTMTAARRSASRCSTVALPPLVLVSQSTASIAAAVSGTTTCARRVPSAAATARARVGVQPLAQSALLVLQAPPASVEVVAPLAERLRQVAQPGLLGEGVEERVLALLDGPLERRAGVRERLEVPLGLGARHLGLGQLRAQSIDFRPERRGLPRELRETHRDPLGLAAAFGRARRELPAALGEPLRPRLGLRGREALGRQLPLHGAQPLLVGRAGGVGLVAGAAPLADGLRRRGLLRLQGRQALAQGGDLGRPAALADRHHAQVELAQLLLDAMVLLGAPRLALEGSHLPLELAQDVLHAE